MKCKIVAVVGSNNNNSITNLLTKRILEKIQILDTSYDSEIICLRDYKINYCLGCSNCLDNGFCLVDEHDDFFKIRKKLLESDIVFFASPVYFNNISGIMKTFEDRIFSSAHLMNYAGKLGFTLTTTMSSGQEFVKEHMCEIQESIGIKNLGNYVFIKKRDKIKEFIETSAAEFLNSIQNNYGYSNKFLEDYFGFYQNYYSILIDKQIAVGQLEYEWNYWDQKWIKECKSFQEFAIKNKKMQRLKKEGEFYNDR
ncbi:flavodoxin family protein [Crassaminicella indica]|uniref:Flavodoxin family protein n=1 Tax=Crassaminicella indica TaxID=2855394 RepID=A0ABX8RB04_9CLOT|nr:flavodoxin family protein [Crassaminicella indica]QXM06244.1 flavodoxin family protein [Crassaminicella indica]